MVVHQLSIFDEIGDAYELSKAKFKHRCDGDKACLIKVYIPQHVVFPGDSNYNSDFLADDPWLQYSAGISRARRIRGLDPYKAIYRQLRDSHIPVEMALFRNSSFVPEYVIEYL